MKTAELCVLLSFVMAVSALPWHQHGAGEMMEHECETVFPKLLAGGDQPLTSPVHVCQDGEFELVQPLLLLFSYLM